MKCVAQFVSGCLIAFTLSAWADPVVEGIDLISSTRVGRTTFDYTYSLRVQGDSFGYSDASFTVQSSIPGTSVIKPNVAVGRIDAGEFLRTSDTFTVRQDRQIPFDRTKLLFSFSGSVTPSSAPAVGQGPAIGSVEFFQEGGRPGHGIHTSLQGPPSPGATAILRATLTGGVQAAEFALRDAIGGLLATGILVQPSADVAWYYTGITVPAVPFKVGIKATAPNGVATSWESKLFSPSSVTVRLLPNSTLLRYGQGMPARLEVSAATSAEIFLTFVLPTGFSVSGGPWNRVVQPGMKVSIPVTIMPPASGEPFAFATIIVTASSKANPQQAQSAKLRFSVE